MSSETTFGSFTTARLGIYVSQRALDVTGNNITNINTIGYTRQQLDQKSLYMNGSDRYISQGTVQIGHGAIATGTSQLRDPYLDIRYRNETSNVGTMSAKISGLDNIAAVLDEVAEGKDGEGVLEAAFSNLIEQVENLNTSGAGKDDYDTLTRSAVDSLCGLMNDYANRLNTLYENQVDGLTKDMETVNSILESITKLNVSIRKSEIHGAPALEERDERNALIDQLSEYIGVNVSYEREVIAEGVEVDKLVLTLAGRDPKDPGNNALLINGIYGTQLTLDDTPVEEGGNFDVTIGALKNARGELMDGTKTIILGDHTLYGAIQAEREMLTEQGEYATETQLASDPDSLTKRGIRYYQKALDTLASKFAEVMNGANQLNAPDIDDMASKTDAELADMNLKYNTVFSRVDGDTTVYFRMTLGATEDGKLAIRLPGDTGEYASDTYLVENLTSEIIGNIIKNGDYVEEAVVPTATGGTLLSNNGNTDDPTGITALNISVSKSWANAGVRILRSTDPAAPSTDNSNLSHILALLQTEHKFTPDEGVEPDTVMFNGSFQKFLTNNVVSTLATDQMTTQAMLDNYNISQDELYISRDSVMGVELNDETINMLQFQKSFSAACRLMTTFDEMLDKLINGTAV